MQSSLLLASVLRVDECFLCFYSAIETFNLKALARQMQAEAMDEFTDGPQKRTGRDEWGEDDGAEVSPSSKFRSVVN